METPVETHAHPWVQHFVTEARGFPANDPTRAALFTVAREVAADLEGDAVEPTRWRFPEVPLPWLTAAAGLTVGLILGWGLHARSLAPGGLARLLHLVLGF